MKQFQSRQIRSVQAESNLGISLIAAAVLDLLLCQLLLGSLGGVQGRLQL